MLELTRRRLVQLGLGSTALLTAGGGLAWVGLGYRLLPGEVPIALSTKELVVARAVVETLLPADGELPSGVELGIPQRIDEEIWAASDDLRADLKAVLQLIEHIPPAMGFPGRFSSLPQPSREACFQALLTSRFTVLVQAAGALKQMAHLFYYVNDRSWPAIGYDGPWVKTPRPPDSALRYRELLGSRR